MMALDPLNGQPELRTYVPPDSAEDALDALVTGLRAGCSPVLLAGASGIGKTLLLRVLAEREQTEFARVRRTELPDSPDALAGHLFQVLFGMVPPRRSYDAGLALLDQLEAEPTGRSLLLVDHLERASAASIAQLGEIARETKHVLAIVGVGVESEGRRSLEDLLEAGFSVSLPAAKGSPESFREELVREDFPLPFFELDPLTIAEPEFEPEVATEGVDLAVLCGSCRRSPARSRESGATRSRTLCAQARRSRSPRGARRFSRASSSAPRSPKRGADRGRSSIVSRRRVRSTHSRGRGALARGLEVRSEVKLSLAGLAFASGVLAALLVLASLFATNSAREPAAAMLPAPESVAAAPAPVSAASQPAIASPAASPVDVHVNARPWHRSGSTASSSARRRSRSRFPAARTGSRRASRTAIASSARSRSLPTSRRFVSLP